ncbi:hypothetical protein M885DRAFT_619144, partial [Pelagophyceae sp. CCMP2097]
MHYQVVHELDGHATTVFDSSKGDPDSFSEARRRAGEVRFKAGGVTKVLVDGAVKNVYGGEKKGGKKRKSAPIDMTQNSDVSCSSLASSPCAAAHRAVTAKKSKAIDMTCDSSPRARAPIDMTDDAPAGPKQAKLEVGDETPSVVRNRAAALAPAVTPTPLPKGCAVFLESVGTHRCGTAYELDASGREFVLGRSSASDAASAAPRGPHAGKVRLGICSSDVGVSRSQLVLQVFAREGGGEAAAGPALPAVVLRCTTPVGARNASGVQLRSKPKVQKDLLRPGESTELQLGDVVVLDVFRTGELLRFAYRITLRNADGRIFGGAQTDVAPPSKLVWGADERPNVDLTTDDPTDGPTAAEAKTAVETPAATPAAKKTPAPKKTSPAKKTPAAKKPAVEKAPAAKKPAVE